MTTLRQIEANRRNAEHSCGPKTDEGKLRSRRNALKHGLAGQGVVLPDRTADEVRDRMDQWRGSLSPRDGVEGFVFEQLCVESVRIDTLNRDLNELRRRQAEQAATDWDERRRLSAEERAEALPKAPALVVRQLRRTAQGCDLLIERWEALIARLEAGGDWDEATQRLAHDLLGTPTELRPPTQPPGDSRRDERLARARRQVEELSARREALREQEPAERAAAELGIGQEETKEQARLRRYLSASQRRFDGALKQLRRDRGAPRGATPTTRPAAVPAPAPAPPATVTAAAPARTRPVPPPLYTPIGRRPEPPTSLDQLLSELGDHPTSLRIVPTRR